MQHTQKAHLSALAERGWTRFPKDPDLLPWCAKAHEVGCAVLQDPQMRETWLQCEGTWFVGVDALPNDPDGELEGVALRGKAIDLLSPVPSLHPAQLSVTFPGYPRPRMGESDAAFRYRYKRDAAHVDGLIAEGPQRRRYLREPHAFILGLPLTETDPGASPLVVWEGSHKIIQAALAKAAATVPSEAWDRLDLTDVYQTARRQCFETCRRVALPSRPGEAMVLHRHVVHGVAPWEAGARAPDEGRMVAYFRPYLRGGSSAWFGSDVLPV